MSRDQFFGLFKLVFLSQKTKILNNTILVNYERFVSPENHLILQKTVKRKSMVPGGGNQISLKSHNSGFTCRSQKRFSLFYSSSKALSNDVSLTLSLKTAFNLF